MLAFGFTFFCAGWSNCIINNFRMTESRDLLISGITTTFALASIVFIPTNLCASCIFFTMMFNVVTECRYIRLCNDNFIAYRAMLAFGFTFFCAGWSNCIINNFRMTESRDLLISGITTTFALASIVFIPTNLCASCIFFTMMFNVVTECRYIRLCNDNFIAYRAMLAFGFAFFSTCRSNCIINNFRMAECRNNGLFLQDCSAYRAMLSLCKT